MSLTWKVEFNKLSEVCDKLSKGAEEKVTSATLEWHKCLVETLAGSRSGKTYNVPSTKKTYTASAPGEAPAVRTGALRSSYSWEITKEGENIVGLVGSPLEYALCLEKGTSKMSPRPHLISSFEKNKDRILEKMGDWL